MKPISRLRFDALAGYSKKPFFNLLFEEIEWYEEGEERVLGLLGMDVTDQDYGSIIIAQDREGRYRAVHVTDFADSLEEARNTLRRWSQCRAPEPREPDERASYLANYMPIKFSNVLTGKLAREYWRLPHVEGKPLVIAIQDFHTGDAMMGTNSALTRYLYGLNVTWHRDNDGNLVLEQEIIENHEWQGRVRVSGFFRLPTSEYISAVIANPHGTISKFNRMGYLAGFGSREVRMIRRGTHYVDDPNMDEPAYFEREVTGPGYAETWREGMIFYHNPAALFPLDLDSFPGVAHMVIDEDGSLTTLMPREGFHPFMSHTIFAPAD